MSVRLVYSRSAASDPERGICWACARLYVREARVARTRVVIYSCGLSVKAPDVSRCTFYLREPGADDDSPAQVEAKTGQSRSLVWERQR